MLNLEIENFLLPWEKKKFDQLLNFVNNSEEKCVGKIKPDVIRLLGDKYLIGEEGWHIWIHRKNSNKRLGGVTIIGVE